MKIKKTINNQKKRQESYLLIIKETSARKPYLDYMPRHNKPLCVNIPAPTLPHSMMITTTQTRTLVFITLSQTSNRYKSITSHGIPPDSYIATYLHSSYQAVT